MACDIVVHGRVVLVVWGTPEMRDLIRVEATVNSVYEQRGPVVFVARVPPNASAPDEKIRSAITDMLERFMKMLTGYHAVFEGRGFFAAAKRTVLATTFLMSGQRHRYRVHATMEEVADSVLPAYRHEVHAAMMHFRTRGHFAHSVRPMPDARAV